MRRRLCFAVAAVLTLTLPAAVRPQAEVTALSVDSEPMETTDGLRLSRFADFSEEDTISIGTLLEVGDLLTSVSESIDVELGCGEETVLRFSGGFRLLINNPEETGCAVDLLSGTVDALTDVPAEVGAGDITLGVEGTQFSLSLTRTEAGPDQDLSVFEGKVTVRSGAIDDEVETGRTWRHTGGERVWGEVTEAKAERTAALFARMDVAKSVAAGEEVGDKEKSYDELRTLHLAVLTKPTDTGNRVKLAKAQLEYKRDDSAAYHLKRANVTTEEQLETYQIDKRVMPYITKGRLAPAPQSPGPGVTTTQIGDLTLVAQVDPFLLIRQGRYQEAIEILKERAADRPTSKIYCGLAKAYLGLEGSAGRRAKRWAVRALELHRTDHKLSDEEYTACRRIYARVRR